MQISGRFTIAVHILTCINYFSDKLAVTSNFLASSIGVNPVEIRQIIAMLKAAGLVNVERGHKGINLAQSLENITLYDVYNAVECIGEGKLFRFHENPNPECPVGKNIHFALDDSLLEIQNTFEDRMKGIKLKDIAEKIRS